MIIGNMEWNYIIGNISFIYSFQVPHAGDNSLEKLGFPCLGISG